MDNRPFIGQGHFHITNVCNYNCVGCNKFNNFNFTGFQKWSDYKDVYTDWAKRIRITNTLSLIGGEPTLNPTMLEWMDGIGELWPETPKKQITTNSTTFDRILTDEFYELMIRHNWIMQSSIHNMNRKNIILEQINNFLRPPITVKRRRIESHWNADNDFVKSYNKIKDPTWPVITRIKDWDTLPKRIQTECEAVHGFSPSILMDSYADFDFVDVNGAQFHVRKEDQFSTPSLIMNSNNITLHNSDRERAHETCDNKYCHNFVRGKLYKCAPVALWPEFDQQFGLTLDDLDRHLMQSYNPATVDMSQEALEEFTGNLRKSIPQCKFCPEKFVQHKIFPEVGKKHILPKIT